MLDVISEKTIELLLRQNTPITASQIAYQIGFSESSVKHNIKDVRQYVSSVGGELQSLSGTGIWIKADIVQRKKLQDLLLEKKDKSTSFIHRRSYILSVLTQMNGEYTIKLFADDLGVTRKVISEDLYQIQKWLTTFDVSLEIVKNIGVYIVGDEFGIRQALIDSNSSFIGNLVVDVKFPKEVDNRVSETFYNYHLKIYKDSSITDIIGYLHAVENQINHRFSDVSFVQLIEYLTVSLSRIKLGHQIESTRLINKYFIDDKEFESAKCILRDALLDEKISSHEIKMLAGQFVLYGTYDNAATLSETNYFYEANRFVSNLQQSLVNREISIGSELIENIGILFEKKKIQPSYTPLSGTFIVSDIQEQLSGLYAIILASIEEVENRLTIEFSRGDIAYLTMLIDNSMRTIKLELHTLFITTYEDPIASYLRNKLKREFQELKFVKTITPDLLDKEDFNSYDLILSTVLCEDESIIKVSRRVDATDIELVREVVRKELVFNQQILTKEFQMFRKDLIVLNSKAKKKEDVLKEGTKLLRDQGLVESGFLEELIEREEKLSTSIGNGVAIPHVYLDKVVMSSVAIIKLERAIPWELDEMVDVIFILAINLKDREEVQSFFSRLFHLVDNEGTLRELRNAKSNENVYSIVKGTGSISR